MRRLYYWNNVYCRKDHVCLLMKPLHNDKNKVCIKEGVFFVITLVFETIYGGNFLVPTRWTTSWNGNVCKMKTH